MKSQTMISLLFPFQIDAFYFFILFEFIDCHPTMMNQNNEGGLALFLTLGENYMMLFIKTLLYTFMRYIRG